MLKGLIRQRPRHLLAVYIEPQQVEVLRAHRQWRTWVIDSVEKMPVPEGEALFDFLQRLNLRPRGPGNNALLLFLPRTFYSLHREHYPLALKDQLEEALVFDWQENVFHEHEQAVSFFGPAVQVGARMSVPIFSMQKEEYDKFQHVLGGSSFQTFVVIPSALVSSSLLPAVAGEGKPIPLRMMARCIDSQNLEVNRFYNGLLLDSTVISRNSDNLRLFRESLLCLGEGGYGEQVLIHLVASDSESSQYYDCAGEWESENLPVRIRQIEGSLLSHWVRLLMGQDRFRAFDSEPTLKPWQVPRAAWPILAVILLFSVFAIYQVHASHQLNEEYRQVRKQVQQLEAQWKPIEALQSRIAKFQEDQKTLSQFNLEGFPTLEVLTLLAQVTPDDTWLNYLSLRKGQLILRGESKSAIRYLSELSKVEGLTDVRFASPVTRNPSSDMERFNVQLQIDLEKARKVFETLPLEMPPLVKRQEPPGGQDSLMPLPAVTDEAPDIGMEEVEEPDVGEDDENEEDVDEEATEEQTR